MITKCKTCGVSKAVCERCGASWVPSKPDPKACAKCGTIYWNVKKGTVRRGRPKTIMVPILKKGCEKIAAEMFKKGPREL